MGLGIVNFLFTGLNIPLTPRGDNRHIGGECLNSKLKTHLIVALTRTAVADSVRTLGDSNFGYALSNGGTGKSRT